MGAPRYKLGRIRCAGRRRRIGGVVRLFFGLYEGRRGEGGGGGGFAMRCGWLVGLSGVGVEVGGRGGYVLRLGDGVRFRASCCVIGGQRCLSSDC